jgi:predicted SnoaL-like aldol condensation-catalyzing enzyme
MRRITHTFLLSAFVLLSVSISVAGLPNASPQPPDACEQQEKNKAVAMRVFDEILNQGKFQIADEIYASDFVNHGAHRDANLDEDQAAARWEKTLLPDLTTQVVLITCDGDYVTVVWTAHGTNTGHSGWFPATGVKVEDRGITVWRIVEGKIHDEWTSFDLLRVLRQFLVQLKWFLLALFVVLIAVMWLLARLVRQLWRTARRRHAEGAAQT